MLIAADEIPAQVPNFWVPVSQIVPVLALAFVIEARRSARGWTRANKWRIPHAISLVLLAYLMYHIESRALFHLAFGSTDPWDVQMTLYSLTVIVVVLAVNPLTALLTAGVPEVVLIIQRLAPGSHWRAVRMKLRRSLRRGQQVDRRAKKIVAMADAQLRKQRMDLAEAENAAPKAREIFESLQSDPDRANDVSLPQMLLVIEEGEKVIEKLRQAITTTEGMLRDAAGALQDAEEGRAELLVLKKETRLFRTLQDDQDVIDAQLESFRDDLKRLS